MLFMRKKNKLRNNGKKSKMPVLRKQNALQIKILNNKSQSSMSSKMDVTQETQEKIGRLSMIEQNLQQSLLQKQQLQSNMFEYESALKEIEGKDEAYKIVGNLMVMTKSSDLKKDLEQKKEMIQLRMEAIEKQEKNLRDKAKKIQEEVASTLKKS